MAINATPTSANTASHMTVNRVSLMQSERISGQLTYTEIFGATL